MTTYLAVTVVDAIPEASENGAPGYRVTYPDGVSHWIDANAFRRGFRPMELDEKHLVCASTAEKDVMRITDQKEPPDDESNNPPASH